MDEVKKSKLKSFLAHNDATNVSFHDTKTALLKEGYTESEISQAIYEVPYDGKKNLTKVEDPATKLFHKDPEIAAQIGNQILEDAKKNERNKTAAIGAAASLSPGRHAQSHYTVAFFDNLGLPFFKIFFGLIIVGLLVLKFNLPGSINAAAIAIVSLWVTYTFYVTYIKKH